MNNFRKLILPILFALVIAGCNDGKSDDEKTVDTVEPQNTRYEDDTSGNAVNRATGQDKDTIEVKPKDTSKKN